LQLLNLITISISYYLSVISYHYQLLS